MPRSLRLLTGAMLIAFGPGIEPANAEAFVVDGSFDEWADTPPTHRDPTGDGERVDFGRVWIESNAETVTLRLEVGAEINLQTENAITLYLDGDANAATGCAQEGLGADLVWTFGHRRGQHCRKGAAAPIQYADVALLTAPTVSSRQFEISIARYRRDGSAVIPGPTASLVLLDRRGDDAGDRLPDGADVVTFTLSEDAAPAPPAWSIERSDPGHLRVVTWNVKFDGLFHRPAPFLRVLAALDADVVCFQEIWSHTGRQAADHVSLALPGSDWYSSAAADCHIVSRYPIGMDVPIDQAGNYWALIDLPDDRFPADLSIVNGHPPCCDKDVERQKQLDGMAAFVRDLQDPGGYDVPFGTPTIVTGDLNLVTKASQLETVRAGRIADEETFGPSYLPDWDGTALADADPRWSNGFSNVTWIGRGESFSPGKLDYILYSDSNLELHHRFVLNTSRLTDDELARYGLHADDTQVASDHLPVVADFSLAGTPSGTTASE